MNHIWKKKAVRAAVILILAAAFFLFLQSYNRIDKPVMVSTQGRTFEQARVTEVLRDNIQENGSRIGDQIVRLQMESGPEKGQIREANSPNGLLFGAVCYLGMRVIVIASHVGNLNVTTVYNRDRSWPVYGFILTFLALLCLIGGERGVRSALALVFTFICFLFLFFPMIMRGMPPFEAAALLSALILTVTICLINGFTVKAFSAVLSAFLGILAAGLSAFAFGWATSVSGYNVADIEQLIFVAQNTLIDVGDLLFAGILFASLGAVMDIAMDISSAVWEIRRKNPRLSPPELFRSGMNVGRDVMGTMSTTLILAFFGGSLGMWVLDYAYDLPYLQLINSNEVVIQILQGISGSFGVIFAVPITSALSAWMPSLLEKIRTDRKQK
jgi:uncharacterized membrane protein